MASAIPPAAGSESDQAEENPRNRTLADDEDELELIEFRYQSLWARVELEAVFAAGLMGHG